MMPPRVLASGPKPCGGKYGHVVLRVLSISCTPKRSHAMPAKAIEVSTNEPNESKQS